MPQIRVTFIPHLLPVRRGILATAYGRLRYGTGGSDPAGGVRKALDDFAEERPFVRVVVPEEVRLQAAVGTNRVVLGASADARLGVVVSFAAIDNLVKGAAVPVISPVGLGTDGASFNINADMVAAEIAVAAKPKKLIFLTDVAGILDENGQLLSQLRAADLRGRLQEGRAG
jgi:Amino acid kinase family